MMTELIIYIYLFFVSKDFSSIVDDFEVADVFNIIVLLSKNFSCDTFKKNLVSV